ncbi:hypothetical protein COV17_03405 [Candidatus Woesearchaeota archaeon CG10_big_fil_rev_8_21_14_0_10_36_11]|nr:MAG: hypothetical protein COV17_03405 [Candidatus Woesearchaeota archaeon CG10_big_fil_rev_8_21_14_0_10_36_11]
MDEYDSLRVGQRIQVSWDTLDELEEGLTELSIAALRQGLRIEELFDSSDMNGTTFSIVRISKGTGISDPTQQYISLKEREYIERENIIALVRNECVIGGRPLERVLEEVADMYELELPKAVFVYHNIEEQDLAEICGLGDDGSTERVAAALHCTVEYLVSIMPKEPEPTEKEEGQLIYLDVFRPENVGDTEEDTDI